MGLLRQLAFESPGPAVVALLILAGPLAWLAWRGRSPRRWLLAALPVALAGLLLLTDALVQTDREKITALLAEIAAAAQANRPQPILETLTEDFRFQTAGQTRLDSKAEVVPLLRAALAMGLESVTINELTVTIRSPNSASASFLMRAKTGPGPMTGQQAGIRWRMALVKSADRWRIDAADLIAWNDQPAGDLPLTLMLPTLLDPTR